MVVMVEVVRLSRSASITIGSCRDLRMVSRGLLRKSATTGRAMKVMASVSKRARPAFRATSLVLEGMPMVSCLLIYQLNKTSFTETANISLIGSH